MRLFFALPLPPALSSELARWQKELRGLPVGLPAHEGLHLTLAFLGEVAPEQVPVLASLGQEVAGPRSPFPLETAGLLALPSRTRPRVLALGLEASEPLRALQAELAGVLRGRGFAVEERPFLPHLTLARPRGPLDWEALPAPPAGRFEARELRLYESRPSPGGSRYETLGAWAFSEDPPPPTR